MKCPTIETTLAGRYKLEIIKPDGTAELAVDWFDNLITNVGLDMLSGEIVGYSAPFDYCFVGTDSTPPSVLDTDLLGFVAQEYGATAVASYSISPRYYSQVYTYTFAIGAVVGNMSEIGVGDINLGTRRALSRALVKDGGGNPTTITVAADESLRVSYEIRFNIPTADFPFTVDGYDFVVRAAHAATADYIYGNYMRYATIGYPRAFTGAVGATIDDQPAGIQYELGSTLDAYAPGSYTRTGKLTASLAQANADIASVRWGFGAHTWQCSVSPVLDKDGTKTLELGVRYTWAREGELP